MNVVSINVCGFLYLCMGVIGCWVISPFFLSINVSMAGVLYTMVTHCPQAFCFGKQAAFESTFRSRDKTT